VSSTLARTVKAAKRERIGFGENCTWSISSRSGGLTAVTGIVDPAAGAAVTGDVAADTTEVEPLALDLVTRTRSVLPTSADCTV
jgi:hypothetical protein